MSVDIMRPVARLLLLVPFEQLHVDACTRADISADWRFNRRLSPMAISHNLDVVNTESAGPGSLLLFTQVPRSAGCGCE